MKEIWKDIEGYEGCYMISSHGRIKSLERKNISKSRMKSLRQDKDRYLKVNLSLGGEKTTYRVHRLVANAFIPNPDCKLEINHKDLIKDNNHVNNLEWCTGIENVHHYWSKINKTKDYEHKGKTRRIKEVRQICRA